MRVRVSYAVEISDRDREAIRAYYGERGKATRAEIRNILRDVGEGETFNDMLNEGAELLDERAAGSSTIAG